MAFLAFRLDPALQRAIDLYLEPWRQRWPSAAWEHPADYHLTLRFLGGMPREQLQVWTERFAADPWPQVAPLSLSWQGSGCFPKGREGHVLWLGLAAASVRLFALQEALEERVRELGLRPETRPYRPHLTVARCRPADRELLQAWTEATTPSWGPQLCKAYELMKRRGGAALPLYETLQIFPLTEQDQEHDHL